MLIHSEITEKIIKAFYNVYDVLGYGFLEKVYEKAMLIELKNLGLEAEAQLPIEVYYNGIVVGNYFADLVVENKIIVELKSNEVLASQDEAQLINYLKATGAEIGLLFNFGKKPEFKRKIFSNNNQNIQVQYKQ
ncbi:MAG: hypothetical protein RLZZ118_2051 [Bacteroidota bacterium]|jgi:GxxExxY protein